MFDAGARHAQVEQARAAFDAAVADYRQTVLTAFQQVEDQLAALRILAEQQAAQDAAVAAAREAERIFFNQYKAGTVAYTNVVVAQTAALADAETALDLRQSRLVAAVALIQALGGGWDASQLPAASEDRSRQPAQFQPAAARRRLAAPAETVVIGSRDQAAGDKTWISRLASSSRVFAA